MSAEQERRILSRYAGVSVEDVARVEQVPPYAELARIWRGLTACETSGDREALERHRRAAASALNGAVDHALGRVGLQGMSELLDDVTFRGWR